LLIGQINTKLSCCTFHIQKNCFSMFRSTCDQYMQFKTWWGKLWSSELWSNSCSK